MIVPPHSAAVPPPFTTLADEPVWYALRPEVRLGAMRFSDLRSLVGEGRLRADDYIWQPAWQEWKPAHQIAGLFPPSTPKPASGLPVAPHGTVHSTLNLKERARNELRSYLVITAYIWAVLVLLRLHESMVASSYGLKLEDHGWKIVTALVLGKVVLLAEALHAGDRLARRVPALAVSIKSLLFALSILLFHGIEHVLSALWHGEPFAEAFDDVNVQRAATMMGIATLTLVPYFLIREIEQRTGQRDLLLLAIGLKR